MELDFKDVIALTNRTGAVSISSEPESTEGGRWAIYPGELYAGPVRIPLRLLYLFPGLGRREDLDEALAKLRASHPAAVKQIVYANALVGSARRFPGVANDAGDGIVRSGVRQFFWSFAQQQLSHYIQQIRTLYSFDDYISPELRLQNGGVGESDASKFLLAKLVGKDNPPGGINVLLAEAGQGKTYFARSLANRLALGRIPLLIHSEQWKRVMMSEVSSPDKAALHAFRWHGASIPWADGVETDFLSVAQKCGLFTLIFDGFDEYVLHSGAERSASETLMQLRDLAAVSGSQILITARTAFWEAEVDIYFEPLMKDRKIEGHTYRLSPFNRRKAKTYFELRFPEATTKIDAALQIFDEFQNAGEPASDVIGRGLFLFLIYDLVTSYHGVEEGIPREVDHKIDGPLTWICKNLCMREDVRQTLEIGWESQFKIFEELAEVLAVDGCVPAASLLVLVQIYAPIDAPSAEYLVGRGGQKGKLSYHPLLSENDNGWSFTQVPVFHYFLARRVLNQLETQAHAALQQFLGRLASNKQLPFELAAALVDLIAGRPDWQKRSLRVVNELTHLENAAANRSAVATSLAVQIANKKAANRKQKTTLLGELLGHPTITKRHFMDALTSFDFRDTHFVDCHFVHVTFMRCEFDHSTRFSGCTFVGVSARQSDQIAQAIFDESCVLNFELKRQVMAASPDRVALHYTADDLHEDFIVALHQLMPTESAVVTRVLQSDLSRGRVKGSPFREDIVSAIIKFALEPERESSGPTTYVIRKTALPALKFFRANGVLTGALRDAWDLVERKASKKV